MDSLKSVRVPVELGPAFEAAERAVSAYFGSRAEDSSRGCIEISTERYVLVRGASLSVEFFALVEKLYGPGRETEARDFARNILYDLAHAIGRSDARRFHGTMGLDDAVSRLAAGPIHFAFSGWGLVELSPASCLEPGAGFLLHYDHLHSFEAEAWVDAGATVDFPVCIMNAGYSSGWCEETFGTPLVASEVLCRARGDDSCRFIMAPPDRIEQRVEQYMDAQPSLAPRIRGFRIPDFFARKRIEEQLRATRDDLERRVEERTADLQDANERIRQEMRDRARVELRLQQTQRLESLGRLAGGIAHDFNNLLGVIMGYGSILQRRISADDPMHAMAQEITEAAQVAANLTRQLVTFSRTQVMKVQRIELNGIVENVTHMLRHVLGDDIVLDTRLAPGPAVVLCDPTQVEQVLVNLAVNARDAMPEGGTLTIETGIEWGAEGEGEGEGERVPTYVRLSVVDTGCGMDSTTRSKIFDPFFTTKSDLGGTGLGLSTVYGIVTQSGGTIRVESEVNRGTRFDVILPFAEGDADSRPPARPPSKPARPAESILLVEDRVALRALLAQMLEDEGYEVLVARDPDDALRIAREHPAQIDALLTDVIMPGMSGREVAIAVCASRPRARVLFISGYSEDPTLLEGELAGRSAFVQKPVTPGELGRALRSLLDRQ